TVIFTLSLHDALPISVFASFFQMAVVTNGVAIFVLGVFGTWLFAAVDACRTAQLMRAGLAPDAEEDAITRQLYGNPVAWGVTLRSEEHTSELQSRGHL